MQGVTIRVLGCGDAFGSGGRFQSCYLVNAGPDRFLIDCGATVLVAMRRQGVDPNLISTVFLSHLHGDHFGGLPFLLLDAHYASGRTQPLTVAGPPGTGRNLDRLLEVCFAGANGLKWNFPLHIVELAARQSRKVNGVEVTAIPVVHSAGTPSYGLRLACAGKVIGYSGDTEWTDSLCDIARGADLLIVECYGYAPGTSYHLDYQTLKSHWDELDARRRLLTHMGPAMLDRLDSVDCETAEDGLLIEL